jgi:hypothetical protein
MPKPPNLTIPVLFALIILITMSITCRTISDLFNDSAPPSVLNLRIKPEPPITPWDTVIIEAQVTDIESGVENVTLLYGVGEDPTSLTYTPVIMHLTLGDCYNGTYKGEIPPQENGTLVWYYISVSDKAGNSYETYFMNYLVYFPSSYLTISIGIEDINMNNLSASLNIFVGGSLPSPFENQKLILHASNGYSESLVDFDIFIINMSATLRFWYQETIKWKVHLIGNPDDYPFDIYCLRLNFTIWWGRIDRLEGNVYYSNIRLLNAWQQPAWKNETYNTEYPQIIFYIPFIRSQYSTEPFLIITFLMCILIGSTLIIPQEKFEGRISIHLTTFIFIIGFFFQIKDSLPFHIGYTKAELILLYLVIINCVYLISSIITSRFGKKARLIAAGINLFITFGLGRYFNLLTFQTLSIITAMSIFPIGEAIWISRSKIKKIICKIKKIMCKTVRKATS